MNRVIKFRAWNGKEMVMDAIKTTFTPAHVYMGVSLPDSASPSFVTCSAQSYMQFTGLCDVNGVEVYEDDIVYVAGLGNAVVRTVFHCGVFYETADDYQTYSDCAAEGDYPTVIGNIYQNPELLK